VSTLSQRLARAESDYCCFEVTNPRLNLVESMLLDFILAANVQADFENAPAETPFFIELDDDFIGTGAWPSEAIEGARDQLMIWDAHSRGGLP
jgi:hypothetical protein